MESRNDDFETFLVDNPRIRGYFEGGIDCTGETPTIIMECAPLIYKCLRLTRRWKKSGFPIDEDLLHLWACIGCSEMASARRLYISLKGKYAALRANNRPVKKIEVPLGESGSIVVKRLGDGFQLESEMKFPMPLCKWVSILEAGPAVESAIEAMVKSEDYLDPR